MLSKCANPECSEQFRYLHQGKLFHLSPTPNLHVLDDDSYDYLYERFWLCDHCSRIMTLVWNGSEAKIVPLPTQPEIIPSTDSEQLRDEVAAAKFAASAGNPH